METESREGLRELNRESPVATKMLFGGALGCFLSLGYAIEEGIRQYRAYRPSKPASIERLERAEYKIVNFRPNIGEIIGRHEESFLVYSGSENKKHFPFYCFSDHIENTLPESLTDEEIDKIVDGVEQGYRQPVKEYRELVRNPETRKEIEQFLEDYDKYYHNSTRSVSWGFLGAGLSFLVLLSSIPVYCFEGRKRKR